MDLQSTVDSTGTLKRAIALIEVGSLVESMHALQGLLGSEPHNIEALYLLAVCQRRLRRHEDALATLDALKKIRPNHARAWQEEGHVFRLCGQAARALRAYEQAVFRNPALIASWEALSALYQLEPNAPAARRAERQAAFLAKLPDELIDVTSLIHENRLLNAEQLCRAFLKRNPRHVEAMRLLAIVGMKLHVYDDAEFVLESSLEFEPDYTPARLEYVRVLHKRQKFAKALEQAKVLRAAQPDNPVFKEAFASASMAAGDTDTALSTYDDLIAQDPRNVNANLLKGHALKTIGRQEEAIAAYRNAYSIRPDFGDAYWSLANLKTYRFTADELQRMRETASSAVTSVVDRIHIAFALGKAFEDLGEFSQSFHNFALGNQLKKDEVRYSSDRTQREFDSQMTVCNDGLFESRKGKGCPAADPIFIVGLPRAGSTLIEQILSSHSQVDGTMELPNILAIAHRLNGRRLLSENSRYPAILPSLSAEWLGRLGAKYIQDTRLFRKGAPFFVDKMPNNFRHIGLINLILPNAKFIDARRDPMDCCFSGFTQLFAEGQYFTYSLEDIGRYYTGYVELMNHWDRMLPGKILRVQYEDVVNDLETQVSRILDHCGLPFETECLRFFETRRAVRTASSEQVRRPIYPDSVGRWRNFEAHLGPLKAALAPLCVAA